MHLLLRSRYYSHGLNTGSRSHTSTMHSTIHMHHSNSTVCSFALETAFFSKDPIVIIIITLLNAVALFEWVWVERNECKWRKMQTAKLFNF